MLIGRYVLMPLFRICNEISKHKGHHYFCHTPLSLRHENNEQSATRQSIKFEQVVARFEEILTDLKAFRDFMIAYRFRKPFQFYICTYSLITTLAIICLIVDNGLIIFIMVQLSIAVLYVLTQFYRIVL